MEKNNKTKNKKKQRMGKLYFSACFLSLAIGLISLGAARKISESALEINKQTVKIPSYEEIIKENEEKAEQEKMKTEAKATEVSEMTENMPEEEIEPETVKAVSATAFQTGKEITFTSPCEGTLLKRFSVDKPLKSKTMGDFRTHNGVDIKSSVGASVFAVADGTVEKVYNDNLLGTTIILSHNEKLKTQYSNIAGDDMVKEGDVVKAGDAIGCVGNTAKGELLDDAHLHFGVLSDDIYVNPEDHIEIKKDEE